MLKGITHNPFEVRLTLRCLLGRTHRQGMDSLYFIQTD